MKKILCTIFVLIFMLMALTACQNKQTAGATQQTQNTTAATSGGLEDSIFNEEPTSGGQQNQSAVKPTQTPDNKDESIGSGNDEKLDQETVSLDYQSFRALSPAKQREYQESFETIDAFFEWYNAAYDAYTKANPSIEIGDNGIVTLP